MVALSDEESASRIADSTWSADMVVGCVGVVGILVCWR